jgi:hypothetical protein
MDVITEFLPVITNVAFSPSNSGFPLNRCIRMAYDGHSVARAVRHRQKQRGTGE